MLPPNSTLSTYNSHILSLTTSNHHLPSLRLYRHLLRHHFPNSFTFPSLLRSAAALSLPFTLSQLHSHTITLNSLSNPYILTSLISAYSRLSLLPIAHLLLSQTLSSPHTPPQTLVVCYNSLISGYARNAMPSCSFELFRDMLRANIPFNTITLMSVLPSLEHSPCVVHGLLFRSGFAREVSCANCLLSGYAKCGDVESARKVFDEMGDRERDLVSYNAMVSCYAQNGLASNVLDLYYDIRGSGVVQPDPVTLVGVLSACANLGAYATGREVERVIGENASFCENVFLKNALINMHARCGSLSRGREIFDGMKVKTLISWTAIISGYGIHGHGRKALEFFERMLDAGVRPDGVVMVSVLTACSHSGLTDEGYEYFMRMEKDFSIHPGPEHYACVVDLLGRAGKLNKAWELIRTMTVKPDGGVWGSLLGACKIHKNVELGKLAFDNLVEIEPTNVGYYVLLSNIYLDAGQLEDVAKVRTMMKNRGLRKEPGCSYLELKGRVHLFMADDHSHPLAKNIYQMINKLETLVKIERGDVSEEVQDGSEKVVGFHSEKLAIAFGLLSTKDGSEIVVIKNLRVCEDCHVFMKMVSKIVNRKLVVRDATRFHHFEGGACSCNDYW